MITLSLKTKMALAVSTLFVLVIALFAWGALSYQERSLKDNISRQQFALVSSLAENIDDKLSLAHSTLIAAARQVPSSTADSAAAAQSFLDARIALHSIFDNGLFLISRDGRLIAESPYLHQRRRGNDYSSEEFYRQTVATGKPHISAPYSSSHRPGHPAIFLSAPIFDRKGRLAAILGGSFDLWGRNFLQEISRTRFSETSYFCLLDRDRTIIVHPERSLIMTRIAVGANPLEEKALAGFEGSAETVNLKGVRVLSSVKRLRTTGWILRANYPVAEAYAPLVAAKRYFLLATLVFTGAVLVVTWLLMKRFTGPLMAVTRHVETLPAACGLQRLPVIDSGDEIATLAQAFNRMVTNLESQQAALRESEEKFSKAFHLAPTLFAITDLKDGRIVEVNESFERLFGYQHQEIIGKSTVELGIWRNPEDREQMLEVLRDKGEVREREITFKDREGNPLTGLFSAAIIDLRGEPYLLCLHNDITARKRAEREIEVLNAHLAARAADLEAVNQELEAFNYTVSHDLRTPLTAINSCCELLMELDADAPVSQGREYIGMIHDEAWLMNDLISALLDFASLSRVIPSRERVDLSALAQAVIYQLRIGDPGRQVTFSATAGLAVEGDARLLRIVLDNLLGNAWKYTQRDGAEISFGMTDVDGKPAYFVRDNGPGFDMADSGRLFRPFQRLPGTEGSAGHGIGLATVQRIIQRQGGRVWAEGEAGKGATFFFNLPEASAQLTVRPPGSGSGWRRK